MEFVAFRVLSLVPTDFAVSGECVSLSDGHIELLHFGSREG